MPEAELQVAAPEEAAQTPETEVVETTEEQTAAPGGTEGAEPDEKQNQKVVETEAQKSEKKLSGIQKRLNELTRDKYSEREARQAAERRNQELMELLKTGRQPSAAPTDARPTQDQFTDYAEYVRADAVWHATQAANAKLEQIQKAQHEDQQRQRFVQSEQAAVNRYNDVAKETAKAIPDFDEVMSDADIDVPMPVLTMIRRLDNGPTVAYHMAKNPALVQQFFSNPPEMHGILLGQLSATLKGAAKVSNAPPPGKPAQPKAGSSSEPPADTEAYFAWAAKHMR